MNRLRTVLRAEGRRRGRGDDGAVLVEATFCLPIVLVICFGIIDFGFAYRDTQTVTAATRAGARVGATLGRQAYLQTVKDTVYGALHNNLADSDIKYLTIYKADPTTGNPTGGGFETCTTNCARFTFSGGNWVSDGGTAWAFTSQAACGTVGHTDYLGIYLRTQHSMFTAVVGPTSVQIKDHTVMRLEPVAIGGSITSCE